jgi:hypothetical protein
MMGNCTSKSLYSPNSLLTRSLTNRRRTASSLTSAMADTITTIMFPLPPNGWLFAQARNQLKTLLKTMIFIQNKTISKMPNASAFSIFPIVKSIVICLFNDDYLFVFTGWALSMSMNSMTIVATIKGEKPIYRTQCGHPVLRCNIAWYPTTANPAVKGSCTHLAHSSMFLRHPSCAIPP